VLEAILDSAGLRPAAFAPNSPSGRWTFRLAMAAPGRPSRMAMLPHPAVMLNTSAPLPMRLMSLPVLRRALLKLMSPARPTNAPDLPRPLRHPSEVGQRCSPADAAPCYRFYHLPTFHLEHPPASFSDADGINSRHACYAASTTARDAAHAPHLGQERSFWIPRRPPTGYTDNVIRSV